MRNFFSGCAVITSSVLVVIGLFLLVIFPFIQKILVEMETRLSPKSQSFPHWRKTPIPVTLDFYIFNWTNPEKLGKEKPVFQELGPYRFYEEREKVNLTWNDNGTISYQQIRTWHFRANESVGSLDAEINSINAVSLTTANLMRYADYPDYFKNMPLVSQKVHVTDSIRTLLFDGYDDLVMKSSYLLSDFLPFSSPYDKFAWFYKRNNSFSFDGWFNLDTGYKNISRLGKIRSWNNKVDTGFFPGACGQVDGFTGDMFPPGYMKKDSKFNLFSQDLCSTIPFEFEKESDVRRIAGYKYSAKMHKPDDGSPASSESCHCNGECVPGGFLNLTTCRFGAPVFVSFPHFYNADPTYRNIVEGLQPQKEKHEFYINVEPNYGIPIDIGARVQLNMYLQPIESIIMYEKVPRMMIPVLWVDQRATITEPLAQELRLVILVPTIATVCGVIALSLGTLLYIATLVSRARSRIMDKKLIKQIEASSATAPRESISISMKQMPT